MAANKADKTGFTDAEREAMKARARELALEKKAEKKRSEGEAQAVAAINAMSGKDREIATRVYKIVSEVAPDLWPKTMYGMPAWARDGKNLLYFQGSGKFGVRYCTLGFEDTAKLDDGKMWPIAYAIVELGPAEEERVRKLVSQALGQ